MKMVVNTEQGADLKDQRQRTYYKKGCYHINSPSYYLDKHTTHNASESS